MGLMSASFMQLLPFSGLLPALLFRFYSSDLMLRPNPVQSNHAMERMADRCAPHFGDDLHTFAPSEARSRPPSLILFSLDGSEQANPVGRDSWVHHRCYLGFARRPDRIAVALSMRPFRSIGWEFVLAFGPSLIHCFPCGGSPIFPRAILFHPHREATSTI
jgi:hypothetical protein